MIFQQNIKNCLEGMRGIAQMIMNTINNQHNYTQAMSDAEVINYIEGLYEEMSQGQPGSDEGKRPEAEAPDPAEVWFHQSSPAESPPNWTTRWSLPTWFKRHGQTII